MTDTERLDWLDRQEGNLFTPKTSPKRTWFWYGNDGRTAESSTLRGVIDALNPQSSESKENG